VRARYEGAKFDSDVFRASEGILPVGIATAAHVTVTRVEPELFIPPAPGQPVFRAEGEDREMGLYFDGMKRRFPAGVSRDGQVVYGNVEFLDGTRGAHVNISGISGVATKTSYALFLLQGLFKSGALGPSAANTRAHVFNVKGEDLLWLDRPNARLDATAIERYKALNLPAEPFGSVSLWAPPRKGVETAIPDTGGRQEGITPYYWTLQEFCRERLLRFMFAEADNETSQISFAISQVESRLAGARPAGDTYVELDGTTIESFDGLVDYISNNMASLVNQNIAAGTRDAFVRRFEAAAGVMGTLIRAQREADAQKHRIDLSKSQVSVVDIHNLPDRAKRFVVGVVVKRLLEDKERQGVREPLSFLVLDELNKYAPRDGWSPIKEVLLDIAERGRSLGIVLIGAQQTASEVERRITANASFRVVGRLDAAESQRDEYGFLTTQARVRSTILKPGAMFLLQPEIPIPILVQFPFPAWATRADEAEAATEDTNGIPRGFLR
jgi:DNA helicase HerA-like ATPase